MSEAPLGQVGRLLVATVHQAITDELPARLDFYEHWLKGERVRDGGVGLAPMSAVLGFLRAEGDAGAGVRRRAGALAAEWTWADVPAARRQWLCRAPRWWRLRAVARLAAWAIRDGHSASVVTWRVHRGTVEFRITHALFCRVRDRQAAPQCEFLQALIDGFYLSAGVPLSVQAVECAATGAPACVIRATPEASA
jgi:hypothetical protein